MTERNDNQGLSLLYLVVRNVCALPDVGGLGPALLTLTGVGGVKDMAARVRVRVEVGVQAHAPCAPAQVT